MDTVAVVFAVPVLTSVVVIPSKCIAPVRPVIALATAPLVTRLLLLAVTVVSIARVVTAPVPLPINTSPEAKVPTPVPPRATPNVPLVNLSVLIFGISAATKERKVGAAALPDAGPASILFGS